MIAAGKSDVDRLKESNRILREALTKLVEMYIADHRDPQKQYVRTLEVNWGVIPEAWRRALTLLGFRVRP